jgi:hypothetical protein
VEADPDETGLDKAVKAALKRNMAAMANYYTMALPTGKLGMVQK